MKKYITALALWLCTITLSAQDLYPDSAVVIGITHFGFGTGEESGNRVSVRDSQGNIYAVYCYAIGGPYADSGEIFYVYSTDNGFTWSEPANTSQTDSATSTEPNLVIDSQDRLHCVWKQLYEDTSTTYYDYDLYYSQNTDSGWTSAINITNQGLGMNACYSSMVVDSRDYVHVVYDMSTGSGNWDIFYVYYKDTVWSVPYQISTSPYDDAFPALAIDHADNLHLIWRQLAGNGVIYYCCHDGNSWSAPEIIVDIPGGHAGYPCIVADAQCFPMVIYGCALPSDSGDIYYTAFDGVAWSEPLNLSNTVHPSGYSSMAIDSVDNLYVVWSEKTNVMNREIYYCTCNGATWSDPINLSQDSVYSCVPKLGNPVTANGVDLIWVNDYVYPDLHVLYMKLSLVGIEEESESSVKSGFRVSPNPFKNSVAINYNFTFPSLVKIRIYDASGRLVDRINQGTLSAGNHRITWSSKNVSSGVYFIRLDGDDYSTLEKIIKTK